MPLFRLVPKTRIGLHEELDSIHSFEKVSCYGENCRDTTTIDNNQTLGSSCYPLYNSVYQTPTFLQLSIESVCAIVFVFVFVSVFVTAKTPTLFVKTFVFVMVIQKAKLGFSDSAAAVLCEQLFFIPILLLQFAPIITQSLPFG